jgi:hypothetical protein
VFLAEKIEALKYVSVGRSQENSKKGGTYLQVTGFDLRVNLRQLA